MSNLKHSDLMCVKIDISKACDSILWDYLFGMLKLMRFPVCWIEWIRTCLCSASFQVLVNGEPGEPFTASNGVRQGDPLAPYLFLIGMQGLSCLLAKAVKEGVISPVVNKKGVHISHILYAVDVLLLTKADYKNARAIKYILKMFGDMSGLRVNPSKSKVFLGRASKRLSISSSLGKDISELLATYLGLPLFNGKLFKDVSTFDCKVSAKT